MGNGAGIQSRKTDPLSDRRADLGADFAPSPVHLPFEPEAKRKEIGWCLMGRTLKRKAEAESVIGRTVTLHRVHNLSVQEKELGACHDIRIHVAVVPRQLYPSSTIKPEKQYFPRQHIRCSCLQY
jgi:hypothetical protein